jgi:hypothetical protein
VYRVPQFIADKPVEQLLGPGRTAEALNDDCRGSTLDWRYAHDVPRRFAGLALRARRAFGLTVERWQAHTTAFSVHGPHGSSASDTETGEGAASAAPEDEPAVIAVPYGDDRDHRDDLKPWMLALVTSGEGVPQCLQPLGSASSPSTAMPALNERCWPGGRPAPSNGKRRGRRRASS